MTTLWRGSMPGLISVSCRHRTLCFISMGTGRWKSKTLPMYSPTSDRQDLMLSVQRAIVLPLLHHLVIICVISHCHWAEPLRGEPTSHYRDSLIHDAVSDGPEGINKRHTTPLLSDWRVNEEWAESLDKFGYQIMPISNIISQEKGSSTHLSPFPKANTQV